MEFEKMIDSLYLRRNDDSIKNDFGKVLLLGGSEKYPNAILISAALASVSGVGFVSIGVPGSIYVAVSSKSPLGCIFEPCDRLSDSLCYESKRLADIMKTYPTILFGNGLAITEDNRNLLIRLLTDYEGTLVIDASGISLLATIKMIKFKPKVILTPHLGEANRLLKTNIHSRDPIDYVSEAKKYCIKHDCLMLLKSSRSILVDEKGDIYPSACPVTPSLAKAGSGDGLAGYLSGILAYASKDYSVCDCVLFADRMIHEAAFLSEKRLCQGISDILTAKEEIIEVIKNDRCH